VTKLDISLDPDELEWYLRLERTVRLATVDPDGTPHVIPLWFVWADGTMFMNSTDGNVTVRNVQLNPRATGCIDDGTTYGDLRGVVVQGTVERAGDDPRLPDVEHLWSEKYLAGNPVPFAHWRNRVWLRMKPDRFASWDFRKIADARAKARGKP
jgi:nitroimidazol reductase NimA-like FMN-containing flavoprotein (pyridoxamine 5'-phosphate oxidase superfamily)